MTTSNRFVSDRQWDSYARRCERNELKEHGTARAAVTISNVCGRYIIEERPDHKLVLVREGWREAMRHAANPDAVPFGYEVRGEGLYPVA